MMRWLLIMVWLMLSVSTAQSVTIADEQAARHYCDRAPLLRIEGIWEFPSDGTRVLIRKGETGNRSCDIILLSSPDCRLTPGETIGSISPAPEQGKFRLSLCRRRSNGILTDPAHCAAKLSSSGNSITIKPRKFKIGIRSMWFMPKLWRALRLSLSDPEGELLDGMIRIYPVTTPDRTSDPIYL